MWISRLRCAGFVLIGICLCCALPARAGVETVQCALGGNALPNGPVVLLPSGEKNYRSMKLQLLSNPSMSGVAVQVNWSDIEASEDKPGLVAARCAVRDRGRGKEMGTSDHVPRFLLTAVGARRGADGSVRDSVRPGQGHQRQTSDAVGSGVPGKMVRLHEAVERPLRGVAGVQNDRGCRPHLCFRGDDFAELAAAHRQWMADGYAPARYLSAWDDTFHFYAETFRNQCISLSAPGLPILGAGPKGRAAHLRAKQEVIERAARAVGNRLAIQSSDLHAGHAAVEAPDNTEFINSYSGRIITGFEMRSGSQDAIASKVMGAEGDPPLALRRSIDKGMARNSGGDVNYLEIYAADVAPAAMQPVLQYAAQLFAASNH